MLLKLRVPSLTTAFGKKDCARSRSAWWQKMPAPCTCTRNWDLKQKEHIKSTVCTTAGTATCYAWPCSIQSLIPDKRLLLSPIPFINRHRRHQHSFETAAANAAFRNYCFLRSLT